MLVLRDVRTDDRDLLFRWANDPDVRRVSFHSEPIPYEDHVRWFEKLLNSDHVRQFVLEEDAVPVGQVRIDISGEEAEISYSVAAEYRGLGYGNALLRMLHERVRAEYPQIKVLCARVKPDNLSSQKTFEKLGYDRKYVCYEFPVG